MACHACRSTELAVIEGFETMPQVTSDCKPWPAGAHLQRCRRCGLLQKRIDAHWSADVDRIYRDYAIYEQSGGAEQVVFVHGPQQPIARSREVVGELLRRSLLPPCGRLLDVGCGNGGLLKAVSQAVPGWSLTGTELSDRNRQQIEEIPGVEPLHVGPVSTLDEQFDVVTMIHSLEHMVSPDQVLSDVRDRLSPSGMLVIDVPDYEDNPFDLVVADHASHFEGATLQALLGRVGFHAEVLPGVIPKEMVLVATPADPQWSAPAPPDGADVSTAPLRWLRNTKDRFRAHSDHRPIGIFGSSVAASWTSGVLGCEVDFFVDEDPNRVRRAHLGRPIMTPDAVPDGSYVMVPIAPVLARAIADRNQRAGVTYWLPPPLSEWRGTGDQVD